MNQIRRRIFWLHITGFPRAIQSYFGDMTNDEFARFGIRNCEIRKFEYKE